MKRISTAIYIFVLFSLLLVSCGPVTAVPTVTPTQTEAALPIHTISPQPSFTATLSQLESAFVIPTQQPDFVYDGTPKPIATPSLEKPLMKLKEISEQDLLNLIYEANRYSYQNFPPMLDWWSEGQFIASQEPVALLIQEYLYRFPQSPNADRLRWQLAFVNSIMYVGLDGNQYGDEWMISELQRRMNQGEASPDQLENILGQYWFDVAYVQPIENMFGDGKLGWLYMIVPQVWEEYEITKNNDYSMYGGVFIVVREISEKTFQIILLNSAWNFSFSESSVFTIEDHNGNGIPDIALYIGGHSGTMCAGNLLIYEWKEDAFVELTNNSMAIRDCGEDFEYSEVNNTPAITYHAVFPVRIIHYLWNGKTYELLQSEYSDPIEKWLVAQSFSEEANAIVEILSLKNKADLNSSQIDFLRFRLGIAYALNSEVPQAKQALQDLIDHPLDTTRTVYSEFAGNFLKYYFGDQSLALACRKSRELLDNLMDTSKNDEDLLGFPTDFTFGIGRLRCFDREVFDVLLGKLPVTVENVPGELRKSGMNIYYAEKQDVNLDGLFEEWLMILDDGVFVVLPHGSNYKAVELDYFWYGEDVGQYTKVNLSIERWAGLQDAVMTISTGKELSILSIGQDYDSTSLGSEYDVKDIFFSTQEFPAQYQVFYIKPNSDNENYYGVPWNGYRWDSAHDEFRNDLIEYKLFVEHSPKEAVELANIVIPILIDWKDISSVDYWLPKHFYLCGLSYELSGDTQKAAQIYWQLWHDFPESHYALLASYKLEPVSP